MLLLKTKNKYLLVKGYLACFIILCFTISYGQQSWFEPHSNIILPNIPNANVFEDLVGSCGGNALSWESNNLPNNAFPAAGIIRNFRNFHLMEIEYDYSYTPADGILAPATCPCNEDPQAYGYNQFDVNCIASNCNQIFQPGEPGETGSLMGAYKVYYCSWKDAGLYNMKQIYASLEAINVFNNPLVLNCVTPQQDIRSYPDKWYTVAEWGGKDGDIDYTDDPIYINAKNYTKTFAASYCPDFSNCLVDVLEIGNEPWGIGEDNIPGNDDDTPGVDGYHRIVYGVIDGLKEFYNTDDTNLWPLKLSTAAFEAFTPNPGCFTVNSNVKDQNQFIGTMLPDAARPFIDYVAVHNYAFPLNNNRNNLDCNNTVLSETPESPNGMFLTIKNMRRWMDANNMAHAKLNITEFGWNRINTNFPNCYFVGEASQAMYTIRAFLIAARHNINKAFLYQFQDSDEETFCTIGLFKNKNNFQDKSANFLTIEKLMMNLKDKKFLHALEEDYSGEGKPFAFLLGEADGTPTHLVAWRSDKFVVPPAGEALNLNYPNVTQSITISLPEALSISSQAPYFYLSWDFSQDGLVNGAGAKVRINGSQLEIDLTGMPVVIPLNNTNCKYFENGSTDCDAGVTVCANQGGDTDNDGICNNVDNCIDTPNADQADSDGNGIGDVCENTNLCNAITLTASGGTLNISGHGNAPISQIQIFDLNDSWNLVYSCSATCPNPENVVLAEGNYHVRINLYTTNWQTLCQFDQDITLGPGGNPCDNQGGDSDGDGVCNNQDNCIGISNPDQADSNGNGIGDACDSSNPCDAVVLSASPATLLISGQGIAANYEIQIFDTNDNWNIEFTCFGNCSDPETVSLAAGNYHVRINLYDANWQTLCQFDQDVSI